MPAGPEDELRRGELVRRVWSALDALPARYSAALELKYIQGLSLQELGARLGLGAQAAGSLLARARGAFRDAFAAASPPTEEPSV
jgi:RNA polymerase sigma-70 factor (ECF subfamily)